MFITNDLHIFDTSLVPHWHSSADLMHQARPILDRLRDRKADNERGRQLHLVPILSTRKSCKLFRPQSPSLLQRPSPLLHPGGGNQAQDIWSCPSFHIHSDALWRWHLFWAPVHCGGACSKGRAVETGFNNRRVLLSRGQSVPACSSRRF